MSKQSKSASTSQNEVQQNRNDTAVIGMACRFPGARGYEQFWDNLKHGINSIQEIPLKRWDVEQFYSPDIDAPNKSVSKWCGLLDEIDSFDHSFFRISPREATAMDPQQRMLLEETWHCIEDSGLSPEVLSLKKTSVHVGVMNEDYRHEVASFDHEIDGYECLGNIESILANRISHNFDFHGSSISVNAACASSLVAMHEARQQLSRHENDYALVCSVNLSLHPWKYISFSKARMLSPDGQCKTFDKDANGYVPGDGVGVLLLQRLEDAIAHGNHVYGVIRGSSVNHGGKALSITAPEIEAQQDVIASAYEDAAFSPESVNYVEAHGTGTSLGDPIEIAALTKSFRRYTENIGFCKIGSVKTNIGHLEAAAGIAGVIKVLLMMKHRQIPPTLNIKTVNPIIEFEKTPFRIATGLNPWERVEKGLPLRAGVSSFGFGGVNAHVLIEEYDGLPAQVREDDNVPHFFALSAHSPEGLKRMVQTWKSYTQSSRHEEPPLPDICRTLLAGRKHLPYRYGRWVESKKELQDSLHAVSWDLFEHSKDNNWCLRINRQPWSGYEDVRQLAEKTAFFNQNVERFYPEDRKARQYLTRNFKKSVWPKRSISLYSFIAEYAYVSSLFDLGFRPNMVTATLSGIWVALVVSGIVDYDEVINILRGDKKIDQIRLRRPFIPFYDPVRHQAIMPFHFTAESVRTLVENVKIPKDLLAYYLEKAKVLRTCQFTFKKFLEEWDKGLRQTGYSIEIIDDDTLLTADTEEANRKRTLAMIIVLSSLRKLNRKWKLEEDSSLGDNRLNELLDVVAEGVMPQDIFIELVLPGKTKYKEIAKTLNTKQRQVGLGGASRLLTRQKDHLSEIKDAPRWIAKMMAIKEEPRLSDSDWNYFDFGEQTGPVSQDVCNVRLHNGSYPSLIKAMSELWLNGVSVNWEKLYLEGTYQKCSLPCYPFERHSFWATSKPEGSVESSRIDRTVQEQEELRASVQLTGHEFYLTDHIIMDQKILPGVVSLEFARAAAEAKAQKKVARISDIIWARPVIASSGGPTDSPIELSISLRSGNDSMEYQVRKVGENDTERTYTQGKIIFGNKEENLTDQVGLDLDAVKKRLKYRKKGDECYHNLLAAGYQYGPCFQPLREISGNEREVLAHLELPKACGRSSHDFFLHPVILDGALQSALMLLGVTTSNFYLPFSVDEVAIGGPLPERCYAHASLTDSTQASDSLGRAFNIVIVDENGRILVSMKEVVMRPIPQKINVSEDASQGSRVQYYTNEWLPIDTDSASLSWLPDQGSVLLFDTTTRIGDIIRGQLNKSGKKSCEVILVKPGKAFRVLGTDSYEIDPGRQTDYQLLLESLEKEGRTPAAFIHYWSRSRFSANRESLSVQLQRCPYSLLYLCQALMVRKLTEQTRLIFLHNDQENKPQPQYLAVSGLARTIRLENPRLLLTSAIVRGPETDPLALDTMMATAALTELRQGAVREDEVLHVEGLRYKRHFNELIPEIDAEPAMVFKKRGVYLISGGAGGVGLIIADHLAKTAQARLALIGRSELSAKKKEIIRKIEAHGSQIIYINADISNQEDVESLIGRVKAKFGEIDGIIHAAGVIRDSYAARKTPEEFKAVLAAKVFGTVWLDIATKDEPLGFFALFSSTTSVMGNAGQSDYAYANSFLDRYAEQREALHRQSERSGKTVSINWPLWKDGGMKIDSRTEEFLDKTMGMKPLESQQGVRAFELGLQLSVEQLTVVNGDPSKIRRFLNPAEAIELSNTGQGVNQTVNVSNETLFSFVERELKSIAGKILEVAQEAMDTETSLGDYGFDSIGLTDYASRLNRCFHLELTPAIFFDRTTIGSLASYLINDWRDEIIRRFSREHIDSHTETPGGSAIDWEQNVLGRLDDGEVHTALLKELTTIARKILAIAEGSLDPDASWDDFGFDSISLTDYANQLNARFDLELTPALFFDCTTLGSLSLYLVKHCGDQVISKVALDDWATSQISTKRQKEAGKKNNIKYVENRKVETKKPDTLERSHSRIPVPYTPEPIAIVGMSGLFPMARDIDQFWDNLVVGKDCISEIPKSRWDWREYYGDPGTEKNKTNVKWGGFIDGVDEFDPLFFGITPREAEFMDPQQRLLMISVWKAIEDAGYSAQSLSGKSMGIFVGMLNSGYNSLFSKANLAIEGYSSTGIIPSIGPSRMSYFLNIHGPSEPIETACSSSLVAINRAVCAIERGSCNMAVAGGVNVILTPELHLSFSKAGMLSRDGRCKTFSDRANGYVRGEGAGMIVLKRLKDAEQAGDHIYGVIRSTAENHGGRANSLTAPNPKAQAELLRTAYSTAGIDPRTIGYIEAHGTGTELGDPIEVNALKTAFANLYRETGYKLNGGVHCGLGSVKTNIGHLEIAAGIAGVIKVLLQLKHRTLVQSLHCSTVNPYIELEGSPFYIVRETGKWNALRNEDGKELPRRAGVSSFGYGGVNAHVVFEEYIPREKKTPISPVNSVQPVIIVLSAKTEGQLREQACQLRAAIKEYLISDDELTNMAFTLQVGRDAMNERLAMQVDTMQECEEKLRGFLEGRKDIENVYRGQVKQHKEIVSLFTADEELQEAVDKWVKRGKYAKVLNLWVNGLHVDWNGLYASGIQPNRISLPTYPFSRQRYWVPSGGPQVSIAESENMRTTEASVSLSENEFMWLPRWTEDSKQPVTFRENGLKSIVIMCSGQTSELAKTIDEYHRKNTALENIIFIQLGDQTKRVSGQEWICGVDDSAGLHTCLGQLESVDRIYFISAGHGIGQGADLKVLFQSPQYNEIQLLRLVRFLKKQNAVSHRADCYVITQNTCSIADEETNPYGSGISGLAYSIAQGEYQFAVRNIDISEKDLATPAKRKALMTMLQNEGATDRGEQVVFRAGRRYVRSFFLLDDSGLPQETGLKEEGVYIILGGSGSIGVAITRYLMQEYNAKVVWIGRKPETAKSILEKIESMREWGEPPLYIQADTTSINDMKKAVVIIKKYHPIINGAIFSGVVFKVQNSIAKTTEKEFTEILDVKNKGIINFHEVFQDESLDFLCLFSSAQAFSFSGAAHFSAYACGITFSDVFSGFLARTSRFPIGIVNWGFWKPALKVASPDKIKISGEVGFLEDNEGIGCFERFIRLLTGGFLNQSICMNAPGPVRELMRGNTKEVLRVNEKSSVPLVPFLLVDKIDKKGAPDLLRGKDGSLEVINQWVTRLLFEQIRRLGIFQQNDVWDTRQALREKSAILEKYDRWLKECLNTLEAGEYICSKNGVFSIIDSNIHENRETVWQEWECVKEYRLSNSDFHARIYLMDACLRALPEILRGHIPATDIMFPASSMELVQSVYTGNVLSDFFNSLVADAVGEYVQERVKADPRAKVRIIEIGAGTGSTSAMVFDRLKPHADHVEYCYTDISKSFLLYAKEQYGPSNPFLHYKLWNIEKPLTGQEVELGSYDLAIATNVMHATKNIRQAIRNAKASLKANGILLLNEMIRKSVFTTLTFGLLDGWWLFEDEHLRISGAPLLDPRAWNEVLKEEGFRAVHFPTEALIDSDQQVIAAESDGIIRLPVEKNISTVSEKELADTRVKSTDQMSINHDMSLRVSRQALQKAQPFEFAPENNLEQHVEEMVSDILSQTLKVPTESIDNSASFSDYGIDSIVGIAFVKQLNDVFGTDLNSAILFDYPSVHSITKCLVTQYGMDISKQAVFQDKNGYEHQNEKSMSTDIQSVPKELPIASDNLINDPVLFKHLESQFLDDEISAGSLIELILDDRK